jgi:hypothetical protein
MLWLLGLVPRVPHAPVEWTQQGLIGRGYVTFTLLDLAWLVAYLALVFGYRRAVLVAPGRDPDHDRLIGTRRPEAASVSG